MNKQALVALEIMHLVNEEFQDPTKTFITLLVASTLAGRIIELDSEKMIEMIEKVEPIADIIYNKVIGEKHAVN